MTLLAALLALVSAVGGWAQLRLEAQLGWQGTAVAGAVNPLWVTVENRSPRLLAGVLRLEQEVGSGWRGRTTLGLRAPILLPPGGGTRLLFPWPVEMGGTPLVVAIEAEGREVVRLDLPVRATLEKPLAQVGMGGDFPWEPAVLLAPEDLPTDPLLLDALRAVGVASPLPGRAADALRAWAAFGGGALEGVPSPPAVPPLEEAALRAAVRDHARQERPTRLLLALTVAYLVLLGYALAALERGRATTAGALLASFTVFALFHAVLFGEPPNVTLVSIRIVSSDVATFSLDNVAISARWRGVIALPGHWVPRRLSHLEEDGNAITWEWGPDGVRTWVRVKPGEVTIAQRYGGVEGAGVGLVEAGLPPELLGPLVRVGKVEVAGAGRRVGGQAWWTYQVRWVRDG